MEIVKIEYVQLELYPNDTWYGDEYFIVYYSDGSKKRTDMLTAEEGRLNYEWRKAGNYFSKHRRGKTVYTTYSSEEYI